MTPVVDRLLVLVIVVGLVLMLPFAVALAVTGHVSLAGLVVSVVVIGAYAMWLTERGYRA